MAAYKKRTTHRYSTPYSVDGNLARKPDYKELERQLDRSGQMDFDQLYQRPAETASERNARRRAQLKASMRTAQKVSPMALLSAVCVAFLLVVLLLCYVRLNTISRSIVSMKTQISQLEIEQVALLTKYEQAFDLSTVKEAAAAAGMVQPSDSQIYYIALPGEDQITTHQPERGPLERFFTAAGWGLDTTAE
ncbi:MAG: hypothetical protein HDT14_11695 [Oscillibacter sp.]|nr:hypothetical protein [Oscillibacter sp.]